MNYLRYIMKVKSTNFSLWNEKQCDFSSRSSLFLHIHIYVENRNSLFVLSVLIDKHDEQWKIDIFWNISGFKRINVCGLFINVSYSLTDLQCTQVNRLLCLILYNPTDLFEKLSPRTSLKFSSSCNLVCFLQILHINLVNKSYKKV